MKINFIGGFFLKHKISEYEKNTDGVVHYAADNLQQAIISGLEMYDDVKLKLFTAPFLINFPRYKKVFIRAEKFKNFRIVPFVNIKILDSISKRIALNSIIKKEIENESEDNHIIIYGMFDYFVQSLPFNYKNKVCLVVPDLPTMMGGDIRKLKIRLYYWYLSKVFSKNLSKVDSFVFISKYMQEHIDVGERPWIVIEGIYNTQNTLPDQIKEKNPTILYTGTLDVRYGILDLLEAFSLIEDENFSLWICGEGAGKKDVQQAVLNDSRIKYFGQVNNKDAQILQRKATVLVNPRKNEGEFTRYSFPSKTMEYLATGTPSVMYKLDGIPEEYHEYFFSPKDNSPEALKDVLIEVAYMDLAERFIFGRKAREFILNNKNPKVQVGKILDMIEKVT